MLYVIHKQVSSPAYLSLSAQEKADRLWSNCQDDSTSAPWFSSLDQGVKLVTEPMCPVFRWVAIKKQGNGKRLEVGKYQLDVRYLPWEKLTNT